jgi:hypothetical protein
MIGVPTGQKEKARNWALNAFPSAAMRQATSQTKIGWNRVFQGLIARDFVLQVATGTQESYQKNWTNKVYSAVFAFFCSPWKN